MAYVCSLRCGFFVKTKEAFLPLYLSLIRPILEFANQAVSPYLQKDIGLKERLQKLATRLVIGLRNFPYERRLEILGLLSLVHLRLRADLVLVFNILHGRVKLPIDEFFETPANPNLRGHRFKTSPSAVPFGTPQVSNSCPHYRTVEQVATQS